MNLWRRWKYLLPSYRRSQEREMQEELRSLAEIADPGELGNLTYTAEEARTVWRWTWLDNLWRDVRYALRVLARQPSFAAVAVLSLGLGIGANAAIFSLIDRVLWRQLPVREPELLVNFGGDYAYSAFEAYRAKSGEAMEGVLATFSAEQDLNTGNESRGGRIELVSGNYFELLGVPTVIGRAITPEDDRRGGPAAVAILSYRYWQRAYGGDRGVVGRTLRVGKAPYTIAGVAPPEFFGVTVGEAPDVWLPFSTLPQAMPGSSDWLDNPRTSFVTVLGRLRPGITVERASAMLTPMAVEVGLTTAPRGLPDFIRKRIESSQLGLVSAAQGLSSLRTRFSKPLRVLFAMVAIGLLLVSVNLMALQMARADERRRELNVRLAIGAGRWRIVRQLLTETLVVSAAGGLLGLLLCRPAAAAVVSMVSGTVRLPVEVDLPVLLFTAALSIVSAMVSGIIPALRATGAKQSANLQQGSRSSTAGPRRRVVSRAVAALQLSLSMVLIAGTFLFAFSLQRLTRFDTGIARERLAMIDVDTSELGYNGRQTAELNRRILERLGTMKGVESASLSVNGIYSRRNGNTQIFADGFQSESGPNRNAFFDDVGPHFFATLGTRIVAGRDFDEHDTPAAPKVAIVNQEFSRHFFAGQNPVGRNIYAGRPGGNQTTFQVVGVVQDVISDVRVGPRRGFYRAAFQMEGRAPNTRFLVRTRGEPAALAADLRAVVRAEEAGARVGVINTADELLNRTLDFDRLVASLSFAFGVLALILAAVGIYGLLAYDVARRTSEIGIRIALGATRRLVMAMVLREAVLVAAAGLVAGTSAALALGKLVTGLVFGLTPGDPAVLLSAAVVLAAVALGAASLPARRAARLDPMTALRHD